MRLLFLAIQSYLLSVLTAQNVSYIRMFNNQVDDLLAGEISDFALKNDTGDTPAILIEFISPLQIVQLGNGVQAYDPLIIRFHILHEFYDAQDGTENQDLNVMKIAEAIYFAFQDWMPADMVIDGISQPVPVGVMERVSETQDNNHPSVYHFIQEYKTNFVDSSRNRPVGGILSGPNVTSETVSVGGTMPEQENETIEYYL